MPDQFGNPTPQEVLAVIAAERDAMVSAAQTPDQMRNAQLFALGRTISAGFDPRVINANKIAEALQKSSVLGRADGESAIDFEIRRGRQMFEDVKMVDPTTAAEISARITELEAERAEQLRLKAEDQREDTRFKWETEDRSQVLKERRGWDLTDGLFYEVDPKTLKATGISTSVNDPGHVVAVNEIRQRGNIMLTAEDINAAGLDTSAADFKLLGSDLAATKNQVQGVIETAHIGSSLMELFINAGNRGENPQTWTDNVARGIQPIVESVSEAQRALGMKPAPTVGSPEWNEDVSIFERELQRRGLQSQVPTSLLVQFAYSMAKSFDNRVTEQDFLNAYNMLGAGSGNPAQIAATIRELTFGRYETMMKTTGTVVNDLLQYNKDDAESIGYKQGQSLQNLLGVYNEEITKFRTLSDKLLDMYGGRDRHSPGANQGTPANTRNANGRTFRARQGE